MPSRQDLRNRAPLFTCLPTRVTPHRHSPWPLIWRAVVIVAALVVCARWLHKAGVI